MTYYVAGFLFSPDEETVTLVRKARPRWQEGLLNGVGGKVEDGETPVEAMIREFREEAGVTIPLWDHFCTLTGHAFKVYFFRSASDLIRTVGRGSTDEPVRRFSVEGILARRSRAEYPLVENLPWLLPMAHSSCSHAWPFYVIEQTPSLSDIPLTLT